MEHGKVFFACALGAFVGTLVALQLNTYLWWIGLIAGGAVGYFSYEFKAVILAIPVAWQAAWQWFPSCQAWGGYGKLFISTFAMVLSVLSTLATSVLCFFAIGDRIRSMTDPEELAALGIIVATTAFFMTSTLVLVTSRNDLENDTRVSWKAALLMNPFSIFLFFLPIGLWWLMKRAPRATVIVALASASFFVTLFRIIYSDMRLLCSVDAAIGAAIGYFTGSALVGAIAGGIFGTLSYEIVSKRLLKFVPQKVA